MRQFKTTEEIPVPSMLVDQIVGQDSAVKIIKKAAKQRRNVLLLGAPGTGKSMLARAMAQLMPAEDLLDVLVYPNVNDENKPKIKSIKTYPSDSEIKANSFLSRLYRGFAQTLLQQSAVKSKPEQNENPYDASPTENINMNDWGQGRRILYLGKSSHMSLQGKGVNPAMVFILILMIAVVAVLATGGLTDANKWFLLAIIFGLTIIFLLWRFTNSLGRRMGGFEYQDPKLIVDNTGKRTAPFVDATGGRAGALLGDVRHDPLQSGGLGTPAHLRVEAGAIHKANKGVLFIDEIASLKAHSQQELLTAMQEKKYSITGQSEMSSGAIVKTEEVPCDFVLVAAGNVHDMARMHPALRSRIRGNGYEVYVEDSMPDTDANCDKIVQFIAQEVRKDGKIPHFSYDAVIEIIDEGRRKAGRKNKLTLNLRELGGLVRAAGDLARDEGKIIVDRDLVLRAKPIAQTLEHQISTRSIEYRKDYNMYSTLGWEIGKVNGLAVLGDGSTGLVMPIVAEVTPASSKSEGKLIVTGKLGTIAKEAVENVSAIIKKHIGKDISQYDIHVQFIQTYEGVEGDSASVSIALAVISAMEGIPVDQSYALTGSLTVRGEVLPVGGITSKAEAAILAGLKHAIVPKTNADDIYLPPTLKNKMEIIPVSNIVQILNYCLKPGANKDKLISNFKVHENGEKSSSGKSVAGRSRSLAGNAGQSRAAGKKPAVRQK